MSQRLVPLKAAGSGGGGRQLDGLGGGSGRQLEGLGGGGEGPSSASRSPSVSSDDEGWEPGDYGLVDAKPAPRRRFNSPRGGAALASGGTRPARLQVKQLPASPRARSHSPFSQPAARGFEPAHGSGGGGGGPATPAPRLVLAAPLEGALRAGQRQGSAGARRLDAAALDALTQHFGADKVSGGRTLPG